MDYPVDCLVYATGFEVGLTIDKRLGYPVFGRDGVALTEKWRDGASTLHGLQTDGFPNCFIMLGMQAGFTVNFIHMTDSWAQHVAYILGRAQAEGLSRIEATPEAEAGWVEEIMRCAPQREAFLRECTPGYYNHEGDLTRLTALNGAYGAGPMAHFRKLEDWRRRAPWPGWA